MWIRTIFGSIRGDYLFAWFALVICYDLVYMEVGLGETYCAWGLPALGVDPHDSTSQRSAKLATNVIQAHPFDIGGASRRIQSLR